MAAALFNKDIRSLFLANKERIVRDECVINIAVGNTGVNTIKKIDSDKIRYLISFNISNKCQLRLLDSSQFNKVHQAERNIVNLPAKNISIKVVLGESLYQDKLILKVTNNLTAQKSDTVLNFQGYSDFLNFTGNLEKALKYIGSTLPHENYLTKNSQLS